MTPKEEILNAVMEWAGSERAADDWYQKQVLPAFGLTAEQLVAQGLAKDVLEEIERIGKGGFA